jgi:hypothetical protein
LSAYLYLYYFRIGEAHLLQSHTDEAIVWFEKARGANPVFPGAHGYLAFAFACNAVCSF